MYYIPHKWKTGEIVSAEKMNVIENGIKDNAMQATPTKITSLASSITIKDAENNAPLKSLIINIKRLIQEGTGTVSGNNARPVHGITALSIYDGNSNIKCTVNFPEEVTEGTLDFVTGLLTINTHKFIIDENTEIESIDTSNPNFTVVTIADYSLMGVKNVTFYGSNYFKCDAPGVYDAVYRVVNSINEPKMSFCMSSEITDETSAHEWFKFHPTHVIAQIAEPKIYKIDTPILTTKSGTDVFSIDCGKMKLEYYINKNYINIVKKNTEIIYSANRIDMSKLTPTRLNLETGEADNNDYYQTTDYCYIKDFSNLRVFLLKPNNTISEFYSSGFTGRYAFYDINKELLYTGNSLNTDLPARRPGNAAYVRYSFTNTLVNDNSQIGLFGRDIKSIWENYYEEKYILPTELPKKISCIGDSLTTGNYPSTLASLLNNNYEVVNNGVGGETSIEIVARQGARPAIVKPFTIPASGSVNIEFVSTAIGRNIGDTTGTTSTSDSSFSPVTIAGIEGKINKSNNVYTFTRVDAGDAVTLIRNTPVYCRPAREERDAIQVMWIGTNGGWNETGTYTANNLISQYSQMIDYSSNMNKPYLVLGLHLLPQGANNLTLSELDIAMDIAFGRHFINYREYITTPILNSNNNVISCYGLDDAGITPTSSDLTAINNGNIPPSLMSDSTHLNTAGYTIIGNLVYERGKELGYWE